MLKMRNSLPKRLILTCLLLGASGIIWSCSSRKEATLEAEVQILHESVYVWNRGQQPWTGGVVFLNEQSLGIQKPFGAVNPRGFAQLPLREFKQDSKPVSENSLQLRFVLVKVEGYAPKKFSVE
jgi:hypothetical protein